MESSRLHFIQPPSFRAARPGEPHYQTAYGDARYAKRWPAWKWTKLWIQAGRAPATLLVPTPQIVSRTEYHDILKNDVLLIIGFTSFLAQFRVILQNAARNSTSEKRAPRPTHAQGIDPCATSPVSLNPQLSSPYSLTALGVRQFRKTAGTRSPTIGGRGARP